MPIDFDPTTGEQVRAQQRWEREQEDEPPEPDWDYLLDCREERDERRRARQ